MCLCSGVCADLLETFCDHYGPMFPYFCRVCCNSCIFFCNKCIVPSRNLEQTVFAFTAKKKRKLHGKTIFFVLAFTAS